MKLTADYHTHTKYSHGKGTVLDNALAAGLAGLKQVGITDHGFSHPAFGLNKRKVANARADCEYATENTGVKVLLGIESNIIGTDGTTDLKPDMYDKFDIFLAGLHKCVFYKFGTAVSLGYPDLFFSFFKNPKIPKSLRDRNTKTFINVIKNNPVDIITHLNFCCFTDPAEVAKAAADYGTYIELNSKKVHFTDEEFFAVAKTGVKFVIDSDAHSPDRVGDTALVEEMLKRVNVSEKSIMNIDGRLPDFRFKRFKERDL